MAMRTRHSFTAGILGGLVLLAGGVMAQVPSSRIPVAPPRWISNDVKPVYRYAISDGGTSVVLLRSDDTSVVTIEPESGEERLHLRGSRAPHALAVSPDGLRCMVTEFTVDDSTETSRMYDLFNGQQLWERKEKAGVMTISTRLARAMVYVTRTSPFFVATPELRDLLTGDSIRTFTDSPSSVFIDDWHQRIYVASTNWHDVEGAQGGWIVELDAFTGEELRSWQPSAYGPMCRLADSDTLLIAGFDSQRDGYLKVIALDLTTGRERTVVSCASTSDEYGCVRLGYPPKWAYNDMAGQSVQLHGVMSGPAAMPLVIMFDGQCTPTARYLLQSDNIEWESRQHATSFEHTVDFVHQKLYYVPEGTGFERQPLICHPVNFTVDVREDRERLGSLRLYTDGSVLRVIPPEMPATEATIDVMDMQGRLLHRARVEIGNGSIAIAIDGLASGAYLFSLAAGERRSLGRFSVIR